MSTANLNLASQVQRPSHKFQVKYIGPYEIIEQISPVAYKLKLPSTIRVHPVFHISLLKPFKTNPSTKYPLRTPQPAPPVIVNDHEEFEVEKILDKRIRYRRTEYLVKWKGYPEYDSTWEPLKNLENAQEAISDFEHQNQ